MNSQEKKAMMDAYKKQESVGGVYCITCAANGRKWMKRTRDLASVKNRYDFSVSIKSCPEPLIREDWEKYGADAFTFSVLEELKKSKEQTDREYLDDLDSLLKMCLEKEE